MALEEFRLRKVDALWMHVGQRRERTGALDLFRRTV